MSTLFISLLLPHNLRFGPVLRELRITYVTHSDFLRDPKVRERQRLGTAFLVINLAAVATVMLPVRECESITAAHAPF
jgi:hypothetical protein